MPVYVRDVRIAMPLFGTRVAPRCRHSNETLFARISGGKVVTKKVVPTIESSVRQRVEMLLEMGVDTFVCGGIERDFFESVSDAGIQVIDNVAGEAGHVLSKLSSGALKPWHGYGRTENDVKPDRTAQHRNIVQQQRIFSELETPGAANGASLFDCTRCESQECLLGKDCVGIRNESMRLTRKEEVHRETRISAYVSSDCLGAMCRIEELIEYLAGMEYGTVGIAFCVDLLREARVLSALLGRKFDVVAVSCKVGGIEKSDLGLPRMTSSSFEPACNPVGQALVLKEHKCEIAVCAGLCTGVDITLQKNLSIPVTGLIVKDRLLANNPSAALFSHYHVRNIMREL
ncbi:MAG: DUF1847 domain-containing protein [bacterium]